MDLKKGVLITKWFIRKCQESLETRYGSKDESTINVGTIGQVIIVGSPQWLSFNRPVTDVVVRGSLCVIRQSGDLLLSHLTKIKGTYLLRSRSHTHPPTFTQIRIHTYEHNLFHRLLLHYCGMESRKYVYNTFPYVKVRQWDFTVGRLFLTPGLGSKE